MDNHWRVDVLGWLVAVPLAIFGIALIFVGCMSWSQLSGLAIAGSEPNTENLHFLKMVAGKLLDDNGSAGEPAEVAFKIQRQNLMVIGGGILLCLVAIGSLYVFRSQPDRSDL